MAEVADERFIRFGDTEERAQLEVVVVIVIVLVDPYTSSPR